MHHAGMAAGYSGTPLPQKLGIKDRSKVVVVGAPAGFDLGVPVGTSGKNVNVLVAFVKRRAVLADKLSRWRAQIAQDGGLWIAWPKQTSGVTTDITEDTIRAVALPTGLVDNKVCAIDDTWSGLRLVIRKELRA